MDDGADRRQITRRSEVFGASHFDVRRACTGAGRRGIVRRGVLFGDAEESGNGAANGAGRSGGRGSADGDRGGDEAGAGRSLGGRGCRCVRRKGDRKPVIWSARQRSGIVRLGRGDVTDGCNARRVDPGAKSHSGGSGGRVERRVARQNLHCQRKNAASRARTKPNEIAFLSFGLLLASSLYEDKNMKDSTKDQVSGKVHQLKGAAIEKAG